MYAQHYTPETKPVLLIKTHIVLKENFVKVKQTESYTN